MDFGMTGEERGFWLGFILTLPVCIALWILWAKRASGGWKE